MKQVKARLQGKIVVVLLATMMHLPVNANPLEPVRVARYSIAAPVPTAAQKNPLSVVIQLKLPSQIKTVGEAIEFLLRRSGYQWSETDAARHDEFFRLAIPAIHREMGPMTLEQALRTLTGQPWVMRVNDRKRYIGFFSNEQTASAFE